MSDLPRTRRTNDHRNCNEEDENDCYFDPSPSSSSQLEVDIEKSNKNSANNDKNDAQQTKQNSDDRVMTTTADHSETSSINTMSIIPPGKKTSSAITSSSKLTAGAKHTHKENVEGKSDRTSQQIMKKQIVSHQTPANGTEECDNAHSEEGQRGSGAAGVVQGSGCASLIIPPYVAFADWNVFVGDNDEDPKKKKASSTERRKEIKKNTAESPCAPGPLPMTCDATTTTATKGNHDMNEDQIKQIEIDDKLYITPTNTDIGKDKDNILERVTGTNNGKTKQGIHNRRRGQKATPPSYVAKQQGGNNEQNVSSTAGEISTLHSPSMNATNHPELAEDFNVRPGAVAIPGVSDLENAVTSEGSHQVSNRRYDSRPDIAQPRPTHQQQENSPSSFIVAEAVLVPPSGSEASFITREAEPQIAIATKYFWGINFKDNRVRIGLIVVISAFVALAVSLGVTLSTTSDDKSDDAPAALTQFSTMSPSAAPTGIAWLQKGSNIVGPSTLAKFGWAVSISANGSRLAVGAPDYIEGSDRRGLIRVYEAQGSNWTLQTEILGDAADFRLGYSVSISRDGNRVAAGAPQYDDAVKGRNTGQVKVFEYRNESWVPLGGPLIGEAQGDWYGYSVSMSRDGSIVAIGGRWNDGETGKNRGHVRVHEFQDGNWTQLGHDIDGEAPKDISGHSLALSWDGRIVAIGGRDNDGNGPQSGHARVYYYDENQTWSKLGQDLDGEAAEDKFGYSVSLSSDGSILAVGSRLNGENLSESGHVRVYQYDTSQRKWVQLGDDIDGEAANAHSGHSVSLSADGTVVAIGATENGKDGRTSGHTRMFEDDGTAWTQSGGTIYGESTGDQSGWSVSLTEDGRLVAIGSELSDANGDNSGLVQVFESPNVR